MAKFSVVDQRASFQFLEQKKEVWARERGLPIDRVNEALALVEKESSLVEEGSLGPSVRLGTLDSFMTSTVSTKTSSTLAAAIVHDLAASALGVTRAAGTRLNPDAALAALRMSSLGEISQTAALELLTRLLLTSVDFAALGIRNLLE